jgi:succinyl-CoA synthetase beta subunit
MHDPSQSDPREAQAAEHNLSYIGLETRIARTFWSDRTRRKAVATRWGEAPPPTSRKFAGVPLVVRLAGTNVEAGKAILEKSGLDLITADTLT